MYSGWYTHKDNFTYLEAFIPLWYNISHECPWNPKDIGERRFKLEKNLLRYFGIKYLTCSISQWENPRAVCEQFERPVASQSRADHLPRVTGALWRFRESAACSWPWAPHSVIARPEWRPHPMAHRPTPYEAIYRLSQNTERAFTWPTIPPTETSWILHACRNDRRCRRGPFVPYSPTALYYRQRGINPTRPKPVVLRPSHPNGLPPTSLTRPPWDQYH